MKPILVSVAQPFCLINSSGRFMVHLKDPYKACCHIFTSSMAACEHFSSSLKQAQIFLFCVGPGPFWCCACLADVQLWVEELLVGFFFPVWLFCDFSALHYVDALG